MVCALHPLAFHIDQRLSDWPECWLELRCPCSPRTVLHPVKMLLQRGDRPFRGRAGGAALLRLPGQAGAGLSGSRARPGSHGRASAKLGHATGAGARVAPRPYSLPQRRGGELVLAPPPRGQTPGGKARPEKRKRADTDCCTSTRNRLGRKCLDWTQNVAGPPRRQSFSGYIRASISRNTASARLSHPSNKPTLTIPRYGGSSALCVDCDGGGPVVASAGSAPHCIGHDRHLSHAGLPRRGCHAGRPGPPPC